MHLFLQYCSFMSSRYKILQAEKISQINIKITSIEKFRGEEMQDAVTTIIRKYDLAGRCFDRDAVDNLKSYFAIGNDRIQAAVAINAEVASIVKQASLNLFDELPELIRPAGNAYTTCRYAACLRDMDYYLCYATYAIVAGNIDVLNELVLKGLRETYNSLNVPIDSTVRGIQIMKSIAKKKVEEADINNISCVDQPSDYITQELSEKNI